jgi:hypothetical protein
LVDHGKLGIVVIRGVLLELGPRRPINNRHLI